MAFLFFLVCLGGAYGIAALFAGEGQTASLIAWPLGLALFFGTRALRGRLRPLRWRIEDWDFRHCDINDPRYDSGWCLFYGRHFTEVVAADYMRLHLLARLIEHRPDLVTGDRQYVILGEFGDGYLQGSIGVGDFFTSDGRYRRRIVKSLQRESRKYGCVRLTLRPDLPGLEAGGEEILGQPQGAEPS